MQPNRNAPSGPPPAGEPAPAAPLNESGLERRVFSTVALLNLGLMASYRALLEGPFPALERGLALGMALCAVTLVVQRSAFPRVTRLLGNGQLALAAAFLPLVVLEAGFRVAPSMYPTWIRDRVAEGDVAAVRESVLEYLDESPFVKFKANQTVRSQGFRGSDADFAYEWRTDRRGFKNPPEVAALNEVEIVAVGDSFTEGMGVATSAIWPSLVSASGRPAYNLGVQGYAPSQMAGAFRRYGAPLKPRIVLIGYCAGTFAREENFQDEAAARRSKRFTGGIQQIVEREIRQQKRFVTTALAEAAYARFASGVTAFKDLFRPPRYPQAPRLPITEAAFAPYAAEISNVASSPFLSREIRENGPLWRRGLTALRDLKEQSRLLGATPILVYMPSRGAMYYARATGRPLPKDAFESQEIEALRAFSAETGIAFVTPGDRILRHVETLRGEAFDERFPFLRLDGHMSARGHALVAEEVLAAIMEVEIAGRKSGQ